MVRAAERLGMAVQTVSAQVRELERSLGFALLKPAGRGLALTDAGLAAMRQAEQIFQLGEQLPAAQRDAMGSPPVRLTLGVSDALPKLAVRLLMQPIMQTPGLRLLCQEDNFDTLLGELALHRLNVVLADRPPPSNPNLKVYSHSRTRPRWHGMPRLPGWHWRNRTFPAPWRQFRSCCRQAMPPCAQPSTSGSNAWPSGPTLLASLRTVPCSRPLAAAAWGWSRRRNWCMNNCPADMAWSASALATASQSIFLRLRRTRKCCIRRSNCC